MLVRKICVPFLLNPFSPLLLKQCLYRPSVFAPLDVYRHNVTLSLPIGAASPEKHLPRAPISWISHSTSTFGNREAKIVKYVLWKLLAIDRFCIGF